MIRDVPWFPCFASNILADKHFRMMTLKERGIWISLYLECWPNKSVPAEPKALARYLGCNQEELERIPKENYMHFFEERHGEIESPELEAYRKKIYGQRELQSEGGKKGVTNKRGRKAARVPEGIPQGLPEGIPEGSLSYIKLDQVKSYQVKPVEGVPNAENFDDANADMKSTAEYLRASKG